MITTIIHLSDVHIRAGDSDRARYTEYITVFNRTFASIAQQPSVIDQKALIVITGDLFHHKNKLEPYGLELAIHFLTGLAELAPVYMIRGNHDYRQDIPKERDMISALMGYKIPRLHYLDASGLHVHENITFGLVAIQDTLLYGATSGIEHTLPDFPIPPENGTFRVALFHGSITGSTLQNGLDVSGNLHGYPIGWFQGYDAILLGDIHLQQIHRAHEMEVQNPTHTLPFTTMRQGYAMKEDSVPWGYPGSLLQQDMGEPLLGHGYLTWDLQQRTIHTFHVTNDHGYVKMRVLEDGKTIEILHRTSYSTPSSYVPIEDVIFEPWFPRALSIVIKGNNGIAVQRHIESYLDSHRVKVTRISAPQTTHEEDESPHDMVPLSERHVDTIHQINSIERLIEYIQEVMKKEGATYGETWISWMKHPEQMFLSLDGLPETIVKKLTEKSEKLLKFVSKYKEDFEKFQAHHVASSTIHLHKVEWNWILNFKDGNVFDFDTDGQSISILNAKNGYGKSNFLEIICIALFGEGFPSRTSRSYSAGLICDKKPNDVRANTTITFTLQDTMYLLLRTWKVHVDKRVVNPADVILYRIQPSVNGERVILHQGVTAVSGWIKSMIGSIQTYHMSAMLSQNADSDFFTLDRATQRSLLDQILSLDHIHSLQALFKEVGKYYKVACELMETYHAGLIQQEWVSPTLLEEYTRATEEHTTRCAENRARKEEWNMHAESTLQSHTEQSLAELIVTTNTALQAIPKDDLQMLQDHLKKETGRLADLEQYHSSLHAFSDLNITPEDIALHRAHHIRDTYASKSVYEYATEALIVAKQRIAAHPYHRLATFSVYEPMSSIVTKMNPVPHRDSLSYDSLSQMIREFETWDHIQTTAFAEYRALLECDETLFEITTKLESCANILRTEPIKLEQNAKKLTLAKRKETKWNKDKEECMMNRPNKPSVSMEWLHNMKTKIQSCGPVEEVHAKILAMEHARQTIPELCMDIQSLSKEIQEGEEYLHECEDIPFNPRCKACKQQQWRTAYDEVTAELPELRERLTAKQMELVACQCHGVSSVLSVDTWKTYLKELEKVHVGLKQSITDLETYHRETILWTEYETWTTRLENTRTSWEAVVKEVRRLETERGVLQTVIQRAQQDTVSLQATLERAHARKADYERFCAERVTRHMAYQNALQTLSKNWYDLLFHYRCVVHLLLESISPVREDIVARIGTIRTKIATVESTAALLDKLAMYQSLAIAIPRWNIWKQEEAKEQSLALHVHELERCIRGKQVGIDASSAPLKRTLVIATQHTKLISYLEGVFDGYRAWLYQTHISLTIHEHVNRVLRLMCVDRPLQIDSEWLDTIDTLAWFIRDGSHRVIIEKASGFQRFIVGIAFRVAFHQIGFCRVRFHQIFIDEGFTACDADHLEQVPSFLKGLLQYYNTIYLVTHLEDLKSSTSHHIYITRDEDHLSRIQHGARSEPHTKAVTTLTQQDTEGETKALVIAKRRGRPPKQPITTTATVTAASADH